MAEEAVVGAILEPIDQNPNLDQHLDRAQRVMPQLMAEEVAAGAILDPTDLNQNQGHAQRAIPQLMVEEVVVDEGILFDDFKYHIMVLMDIDICL